MNERVLYVGRFQPFHKGHYKVIEGLISQFDEIVIVIGSSQESYTQKNPFTASERWMMLKSSLSNKNNIFIVPVADINSHYLWYKYLDMLLPPYNYVACNDPFTMEIAKEADKKIYKIPFYNREIYSGTNIRSLMAQGGKWEEYVPLQSVKIIKKINGDKRVMKLYSSNI